MTLFHLPTGVKVACGVITAGVPIKIFLSHRPMSCGDQTWAVVSLLCGLGILLRESIQYFSGVK